MKHLVPEPANGTDSQMRYLSQSIRLKEAASPGIVRGTVLTIGLMLGAFFVWSAMSNVQEIARAPGEIIPSGYSRSVQNAEGGAVAAIYVYEGDSVKTGQKLLQLDGSDLHEDLARAQNRQKVLSLQEERLRAYIDGRSPNLPATQGALAKDTADFYASMKTAGTEQAAVINDQISQKRQSLAALGASLRVAQRNATLTADLLRKRETLNKQGVLSDVKLMDTRQKYNEQTGEVESLKSQSAQARAAIAEFQSRAQSLNADKIDDAHHELEGLLAEMAQNSDLIEKMNKRIARLMVTAPVDGVIKGLSIHSVGNVVQPGQVLMDIVPVNEDMIVSVKIPPRYIGNITIGEKVQVKFSSYDFGRYGSVAGELTTLSATTFDGANGERYYEGKIRLEQAYVGRDEKNRILPGMTVMADIITGHKTVLQYLMKPVHAAVSTSFSER